MPEEVTLKPRLKSAHKFFVLGHFLQKVTKKNTLKNILHTFRNRVGLTYFSLVVPPSLSSFLFLFSLLYVPFSSLPLTGLVLVYKVTEWNIFAFI